MNRLGTGGQGRAPGTSSGRAPPSRMRTGAVPGTSAGQQAAYLPSHTISVSSRPITGGGIAGMKNSSSPTSSQTSTSNGPGRQVQDSSFYIGLLRSKITDITKEIRSVKTGMEDMVNDAGLYGVLEKKYEVLLKDVRGLEGTLADYNLTMDKIRTSADPKDVVDNMNGLKDRNKNTANEIDKIFILKTQREQSSAEIEGQIDEVHRLAELKIKKLEPGKLRDYDDLLNMSKALQAEGTQKENELDALRHKAYTLESTLRSSGLRDEYNIEERKLNQIKKNIELLGDDLDISKLDPKEAHGKLLNKVKEDNRKTLTLEKRSKEIDIEIKKTKRNIVDINNEQLERDKSQGGQGGVKSFAAKYELLFQRDAEMTEFLSKFAESKSSVIASQTHTKNTIVSLLEHISNGIGSTNIMPSTSQMEEMKSEVSFKTKQLETSQVTMSRLQDQRVKRLGEMDKINTLDEKIGVELVQLKDKMRTMQTESKMYEDVEGLRTRATFTKDELEKLREKYLSRRALIKRQVSELSQTVENSKKQGQKSETSKSLSSLEAKLRHYEQNIFSLKEYVEEKGRETDFVTLKEGVMGMVEKLNLMAIESS